MSRRPLVVASTLAVLLAAVSACSSASSASSSGSTPTVRLMVGGIDKQIYLPYQLAEQLGYYKKYGVNVKLSNEGNGGVGPDTAMASGQVEMAGAWYFKAIDFQTKGKAVEAVVQLSSAPGERVMCANNPGVRSAADFKGKALGVTELGSGTDTLTRFLAARAGLSGTDYSRVAVGAGSTAIAALQKGKVACVMTTQPTVLAIEKKGVGYSAIDLASTQGTEAAMGGAYPSASVLARTDWVNANKETVQKVVNALVATMHWINTNSPTAIADKLPSSYVNNALITKADYIKALTQDKGQFLPDGIMPAGGPQVALAVQQKVGKASSSVKLGATFTNEFALAANKAQGFTVTTTPAGPNG